jgi:tRNA A-37 threonylcarbamoyl transferase component Bud32
MRACGIPAQETLAVVAERTAGPFFRTRVITAEIPHASDLASFVQNRDLRVATRLSAIEAAARLVRRMHDERFVHADLQMRNLLVREQSESVEAYVIDLDRARRVETLSQAAREANLFRLNRSIAKLKLTTVSRADRLRFLRAYFAEKRPDHAAERGLIARCLAHQRRHERFWSSP